SPERTHRAAPSGSINRAVYCSSYFAIAFNAEVLSMNCRKGLRRTPHELRDDAFGDTAECAALRMVRICRHDRRACVAGFPDSTDQWELAEKGNVELLRHGRTAAMAEKVDAISASAAYVIAHVLDHAEDR